MANRTYTDAIAKLNTLQSNAATLEAMRKSGAPPKAELAIAEMNEYLSRIGYAPEDLNRLNVLHVTGTKGKGSTCAFTDSLLRHAVPSWKVGLYTSPHLVSACERIRINGKPISEEKFAKYFFYVWDKLEQSTSSNIIPPGTKPMYFKFVTLVAFHTFLEEKVDATVLEVGLGGKYDSTNIVPIPVVTGVAALGLDHTNVLGKTLGEIGWQKGGIYKPGVPAFTVEQPPEGLAALEQQAKDLKASSFTVLPPIPELSMYKLGLQGQHQVHNATLAVHLSHQFLMARLLEPTSGMFSSPTPLSAPFIAGLENARWPGRCQTVIDPSRSGSEGKPNTTWYLDGAHTVESLKACAEWYTTPGVGLRDEGNTESSPQRVLIFNCTSGRSGLTFINTLLENIAAQLEKHASTSLLADHPGFFDTVIFCTNVTYADGKFKGDLTTVAMPDSERLKLEPQHQLADAWSSVVPTYSKEKIHVLPSVEHALREVRRIESEGTNVQVLVAGSLHLVGGVIEVAGLGEVALAATPGPTPSA
ncbi:FolC bifunctional protein [Clavulina sp. PMI_390]|nr:FolC bifunctional protein [Clavulina sp. PMI_390]